MKTDHKVEVCYVSQLEPHCMLTYNRMIQMNKCSEEEILRFNVVLVLNTLICGLNQVFSLTCCVFVLHL